MRTRSSSPLGLVLLVSLVLAPAVAPATAAAQTPPPTEITFVDGEQVAGTIDSAAVENLVVLRPGARHSLIRIRTTFLAELAASAQNL